MNPGALLLGRLPRVAALAGKCGVIVNEHTLGHEETSLLVDALAPRFDFIHLDELPDRLARPRRKPFCLLTFDDGMRSNATVTAPILKRLGVPAVFYVVVDSLDSGEPLWFDRYSALERAVGPQATGTDRETLKRLTHDERTEWIHHALEAHHVPPPTSADALPMTWDQVRALAREGFVIGSHGMSHSILTREDSNTALLEIRSSLRRITAELGAPCRTFAFPNGNHTRALRRFAVECGATTVMTTDPGWVGRSTPLCRLPRVQLYQSSTRTHIIRKTALALVPGALTNPDGTGRRYLFKRRT